MNPDDVYYHFFKSMKFAPIPKKYKEVKVIKYTAFAIIMSTLFVIPFLSSPEYGGLATVIFIAMLIIGYITYFLAVREERKIAKEIEENASDTIPNDEKFIVVIDYGLIEKEYIATREEVEDVKTLLEQFKEE